MQSERLQRSLRGTTQSLHLEFWQGAGSYELSGGGLRFVRAMLADAGGSSLADVARRM